MQENKRKRENEKENQLFGSRCFKLGDRLKKFMNVSEKHGSKFFNTIELTQDIILDFLKLTGEVTEVDLFQIQVQTLNGATFPVTMQRGENKVSVLKAEIERAEGTSRHRQELFLVQEEVTPSDKTVFPLKNSDLISGACTVALCAHAPSQWEWDSSSFLITVSVSKNTWLSAYCALCIPGHWAPQGVQTQW
jgi:hypothetical protein